MSTNLQEPTVQTTWAKYFWDPLQINQHKELGIVISGCPSEKWLQKASAIKKKSAQEV